MTSVAFDKVSWQRDGGGVWLMLHAESPAIVQGVCEKFADGKKYVAELKEFRQKRSLDANAYLWVLLDKIAQVIHSSKEEVYLSYIKQYGVFRDFKLPEDEAKTLRVAWEMLGTGWQTELVDYDEDNVIIRAYYGSSQYSTRQMSRLIDMVVEDARSLGIETMTPQELSRLKEGWKR